MTVAGWSAEDRADLAHVAQVIRRWIPAAQDSPLYVALASRMLDDPPMLALAARMDNVPPMNLLFGGVKLALTADEPLAAWYPHLVGDDARAPDADAYVAFRTYVLDRAEWLADIGAHKRTQTNEVGRSAVLLPWLAEAAREWDAPVHLVDLGASAGLNLCLDRFDYAYGSDQVGARDPASVRLTLECDNRGGFDVPAAAPGIASRHAVDLAPVDATDPGAAAWLEALVWPEHAARLERLRAAIAIRRETDVTMHTGDAATVLTTVAQTLPPGPMLVMHSVMAYQLSDVQRGAIDDAVVAASSHRPVARVAMEPSRGFDHPSVTTGLRRADATAVAVAHAHGAWIDRVAR